jgi:hypothetical protein
MTRGIPSYYLSRPQFDLNTKKQAAFDDLWQSATKGGFIDFRLPYPKWQFLSYLCDSHELVLHGSQKRDIEVVEPRQANDKRSYSNQNAIYATTDGIWVTYFAIIDRLGHPGLSLFNACFQINLAEQQMSEPYYFFSISVEFRKQNPWCQGCVYILPRQNFSHEEAQLAQGVEVIFPHWISTLPAKPVAKLIVGPADFPFLDQIHGHDDQKLVDLYTANPDAFPAEALES